MCNDCMHVSNTVVRLRAFHYCQGIATCIHVHVYITVLPNCKLGPNQLTNQKQGKKNRSCCGGILNANYENEKCERGTKQPHQVELILIHLTLVDFENQHLQRHKTATVNQQ